ncbi:energy-coupling factor transporter transmembrane component T family protein [Halococcus saccharolyticus]|uniref:Cobalt ABC transporter permease cbiq n=1 Tax=Halococcus saccharolyticus DSM 5350 TaxID=1227455 RepID=M0MDN9_9EURY|nr:energy-coupling factor transporter transmembrane protein EcfT [Halococcus saccharolyticus]EMA43877.1 cobalt ABC transporter permease cbiq [Halococcus saccharolyticus DSM 5350]
MLSYEPGDSFVHRLDPRAKLAVQVGFALAAFAHTTPRGLVILTALAGCVLAAARLSPIAALAEARYALPFLLAGPAIAAFTLGPPWIALSQAVAPALASYRVLLVLAVSVVYVRTTRVRDSRAAIQRLVPGRPGRFLGVGVALVFRFLPVLLADLSRTRAAMRARLGSERGLIERMGIVTSAGIQRAFGRADRLGVALRARCFAWNPTLPALRFTRHDLPALGLAAALVGWAFV